MIRVCIIPILLLIQTLYATSRVRGSLKFITQDTMTATMTSKHDYDVYDNPVDVVVTFSQETESLEAEHCIVFLDSWFTLPV